MLRLIQQHRWPLLILLATFVVYFVTLFPRLLIFKDGALLVEHEHAWSDWPLHIALSNIFAYKDPSLWFEHHPMYAHGGMRYTFLVNFISGMLMRIGVPLELAFIGPAIIYTLLLVLGIYCLFNLILKSQRQALLVVFVFLIIGLGVYGFSR